MSLTTLLRHPLAWFALVITIGAAPVRAGSPLICHPYLIGAAKTLPNTDGDWKGVNPAYDRSQLARDVLAALTPETPVLVRMEIIRRAGIYATAGLRNWDKGTYSQDDRAVAQGLLGKLRARADAAQGPARALALFDVGFLAETLRQTNLDPSIHGYATLLKARELRGPDADMEFALALASARPRRPELEAHLARAQSGAATGSLLASNLATHFGLAPRS